VIVATTPIADNFVATIFLLRNAFSLFDVVMLLFSSLAFALARRISRLHVPIGTIFLRICMYFRQWCSAQWALI
jgi:hypothetical protein